MASLHGWLICDLKLTLAVHAALRFQVNFLFLAALCALFFDSRLLLLQGSVLRSEFLVREVIRLVLGCRWLAFLLWYSFLRRILAVVLHSLCKFDLLGVLACGLLALGLTLEIVLRHESHIDIVDLLTEVLRGYGVRHLRCGRIFWCLFADGFMGRIDH